MNLSKPWCINSRWEQEFEESLDNLVYPLALRFSSICYIPQAEPSPERHLQPLKCIPTPSAFFLQDEDMEKELEDLKSLFMMLDKDNNGELSASEVSERAPPWLPWEPMSSHTHFYLLASLVSCLPPHTTIVCS